MSDIILSTECTAGPESLDSIYRIINKASDGRDTGNLKDLAKELMNETAQLAFEAGRRAEAKT